ncbi:MAG: family 43 glycosylhydrolase [Oscillospiraceae bacterium]|nr:family 43 glycosylhydrolase [Oscillospiraceae bacterium]
MQYRNPIIPGFFPDPSICRVGGSYYLVCSSFQFFPGVPLFESQDLLNWTQIGHVLTRPSQLPLDDADSAGGIYAPTIRFHNGRFYMVTTNVTHGGNFYVYTDDIHGAWSDPIYVQQDGIDPSLYFEDGHAYFMSNGTDDAGEHGIVQCEIDIATGKKLSPAVCIWKGTGGRFLESPHLYRIGGHYYLMASEGGTEYGHMVVYARSRSLYGPYEAAPCNPVLTNRNLGGYELQGCGHADLTDDGNGNWWMVHLGFRQIHQWVMHHLTGREVYLAPVTFTEDGWFTAGVDGTNRLTVETDRLPATEQKPLPDITFQNSRIGREWCYLKAPRLTDYRWENGTVSLRSAGITLDDPKAAPTFLGIRQQEMELAIRCTVKVPAQEAGLTLYMTPEQHYELAVRDGRAFYRLRVGDLCQEFGSVPVEGEAELIIEAHPLSYTFKVRTGGTEQTLGSAQSKYLSTEIAGNFTGLMIGLYAQGERCEEFAEFTDFCCHVR